VDGERYLKIVHRTQSKKHLRKWMIYSAAAFAWISSTIYLLALVFPTTKVIDGACYPYTFWNSEMSALAHTIWGFVLFYVIVLMLFIFCYWHILAVIRHQASVMAGHGTSGGSSYKAYNPIQFCVGDSNACHIVCVQFYLNRCRFLHVIAKCLAGPTFLWIKCRNSTLCPQKVNPPNIMQ